MTISTTRPHSDALLAEMMLLHPKLIDLSLGRVERLLAKLGHPEQRVPAIVHIAGTNGKGSVTAYLRAIIEAAESGRISIPRRTSCASMNALRLPALTARRAPSTKTRSSTC